MMRCTAQSRYAAAKMTLVAAITAKYGCVGNDPTSTRNSPTNPLVPGTPIELSATMVRQTAKIGMTFAIPPKSSICRVCRRS